MIVEVKQLDGDGLEDMAVLRWDDRTVIQWVPF